MSDPLDDLKRAAELLRQYKALARPFDSVENVDGLATFRLKGRVVGWMNWDDFNALCDEQKARKNR